MKTAYIAVPTHNDWIHMNCAISIQQNGLDSAMYKIQSASLLAYNFNRMWCEFWNTRNETKLQYFILLHSDVGLEPNWAAKLIDILEREQLDVLSVVLPIKNHQGLTSTAYDSGERQAVKFKLVDLPATIRSDKMEDYNADRLLINTGCMIIDPARVDPAKCWFQIIDGVSCRDDKRDAVNMPEDWNFSHQLSDAGLSYGATKEIKAKHFGAWEWPNA